MQAHYLARAWSNPVILVTRLNGSQFYVNAELIRIVEGTPDTVISMIDGVKLIVREAPDRVIERIILYRRQVNTAYTGESLQGGA